ncbi:hypothetical protein UM822_09540 [Staphylococcus aureus]|nr:hypothetical protein UM822_09540 [Staphylococcus aureus]
MLIEERGLKMTELNEIINAIQSLFESQSGYKISKKFRVPYQTVQDLRNGKTKIEDARFRTIIKLYSYYTSLKERS